MNQGLVIPTDTRLVGSNKNRNELLTLPSHVVKRIYRTIQAAVLLSSVDITMNPSHLPLGQMV